ncbi:MAG: hypothetical protein DRI34_05125 [Deltaproteobacteria bacterium]|nr:MAG: hypothetical protein DRI34_05125 [Deltaproteobacteria bacterium]
MIAQAGVHQAADLALGERKSCLFELLHHVTAPEPAQVATHRPGGIVGELLGQLLEVFSLS